MYIRRTYSATVALLFVPQSHLRYLLDYVCCDSGMLLQMVDLIQPELLLDYLRVFSNVRVI
jgi:hypothetical protein